VGVVWLMVTRVDAEIWVIGKGGTKRGDEKRGGEGSSTGAAGFCGFCACLSV
jgi:hypothetical protein